MKVNYTTSNGRISVELEADTQKALWAQLGAFQEIFEESKCRKCGSDDVRFTLRKATDGKKEYDYHELRCAKCGAKLAFGVLNDGSGRLFPKRKGAEGEIVGEYGWVKWNAETQTEE